MNTKVTSIIFNLCCIALSPSITTAKPIFVFDIHGVLLAENVEALVLKRIELLQQQTRSIKDNQYFEQLCALMKQYKPLGQPVAPYSFELYQIPFEVFALFSGLQSPDTVYSALRSMLATARLDDTTLLILTALVDSIFKHHERVSALTPIPSGVALFKTCLAHNASDVYIYTNAPAEWIAQYKKLFPSIFADIDDSHIWCSGTTKLLKPSPDVFTFIAQQTQCEITDIICIDDSPDNCAAAHAAGATAVLFSAPQPLTLPTTVDATAHTTSEKKE